MEQYTLVRRMPAAVVFAVLALACSPGGDQSLTDASSPPAPDSVVLERTACFGTCPVYRLSLTSTGRVAYQSNDLKDPQTATDSVPPASVDSIVQWARRAGFFALPDRIDQGSRLCPNYATDHPSIELAIFGARTKRLHYYIGCRSKQGTTADSLRSAILDLAERIDSTANASRWIRPLSQ